MPSLIRADVIVVGGGIVGLSIALGLLKQKASVIVLDGDDMGTRASRGNFGLVALQSKGMGMAAYANFTRRSSELWQGFADELQEITAIDVAYRVRGGYTLALSAADLEKRRDFITRLNGQPGIIPVPTVFLDRGDLLQINSELGPEVVGASHCPLDGTVNVLRLYRALNAAFVAGGGRYVGRSTVDAIAASGSGYEVRAGLASYSADRVVLAAGLANQQLAAMVGIDPHIRADPGTLIVTEKTEPFLEDVMGSIRQMDEGGVVIGGSPKSAEIDTELRISDGIRMAARAVRIFPRLARLQIVRMWRALRIMTRDGFPVYEESRQAPGVFVCTCHSGITLAAVHCRDVAPMIAERRLGAALDVFRTDRFHVQPAH